MSQKVAKKIRRAARAFGYSVHKPRRYFKAEVDTGRRGLWDNLPIMAVIIVADSRRKQYKAFKRQWKEKAKAKR